MIQQKKRRWRKWYPVLIATPFTIAGFIVFVLYGHRYNGSGKQVLSFFLVLSLPATFAITYLDSRSGKWYKRLAHTLLSMICVALFIVGMFFAKDNYDKYQLAHYALVVPGQVTGFETTRSKGKTYHYAAFDYSVNRKRYRQRVGNDDDAYAIGDSLMLRVSQRDPQLFRILERWQK